MIYRVAINAILASLFIIALTVIVMRREIAFIVCGYDLELLDGFLNESIAGDSAEAWRESGDVRRAISNAGLFTALACFVAFVFSKPLGVSFKFFRIDSSKVIPIILMLIAFLFYFWPVFLALIHSWVKQ